MNRREIYQRFKNRLEPQILPFEIQISEDHFIVIKKEEGYTYTSKIRCQNFGHTYTLSPKGVTFKSESIENEFRNLIDKDLLKYLNSEFTIALPNKRFRYFEGIDSFQVKAINEVDDFTDNYHKHFKEINNEFWNTTRSFKKLVEFFDEIPYERHTDILVGGKFPTQMFKKLFLLKKGNSHLKFEEYRTKFEEQLTSFPDRKPNRKDDYRLFLGNYEKLLQYLKFE